ncbi:hypothetical protein GWK48_04550 [Metallosphaera tengchongensis]|uniref:Uncharacterized protein n=1 Tax=Metallosphaera tengchongensis TaxID=1532350 RepID=A0A6N0NUG0_9CREN|nr:hypothetical protein [Metallosphaera tengchongensis]QKQ99756.1 hypothetical protein GWK48_04550 [Metallosphaera tengchongensis]
MVFEVSVDMLCEGRKGVTAGGHFFCISTFLHKELEQLKVPDSVLVEAIVDFMNDNSVSYSVYWGSSVSPGHSRVLEVWVNTSEKTRRVFLVISNLDGINEIRVLEPFYFSEVAERILNYGKRLDSYRMTMPFLYKFVVFESFNVFRKLSNIEFQGIISKNNEKYMVAMENEKALLWKVESTGVDLVKKDSIMLMHLNS